MWGARVRRTLPMLLALLLLAGCIVTRTPASEQFPGATPSVTPSATPAPTPSDTPTLIPPPTPAPSDTPTVGPPSPTPMSLAPHLGALRVHFIDVGQGDAILIVSPEGKAALIDGGDAGSGVVAYLRAQGVQRLDLVVATHPHADDIGGLVEALQAIPVAEVVTNGQPHTTTTYERFLDAIASAQARYTEVRRGDALQLGSLTLEVLHPASASGGDLNDHSVVLRLAYGTVVFLFTGDVQAEGEMSMQAAGLPVAATVLKVAHHASHSSSSPAFLAAVQPQVAIYSCGAGNTYGHPHVETLAALAGVGAAVYGTDTHGSVVVTSDGSGYSVTTAKNAELRAPPATPVPVPVQPADAGLALDILSVTSPVRPGAQVTLTARTAPGAACTITVYYKSGPSKAQGLVPKTADAAGNVSWTWSVGRNTTAGTWRIVLTATQGAATMTRETAFTVAR